MVATGTFTTFPGQKAGFSPSSELKLRGLSNLQEKVLEEWVTKSGVTEEITRLNVLSIEDLELIASLLGWKAYKHTPGWALSSIDLATGQKKFAQFKPDVPVQFPDSEKPAKYLTSKSGYDAICLDTGEEGYWQRVIVTPSIPITLPEGGKKAGALLSYGYASVGLCGVEMGLLKGGKKLVPNLEILAVPGRRVIIPFDADIATKEEVRGALKRLGKVLLKRGCIVLVAQWDISLGKGIDDVLVNCGEDTVHDIMDSAIPFAQWIESLERQFRKEETTQKLEKLEGLNSRDQQITQEIWSAFYCDKPWISTNGKLYQWTGTHYEHSPDCVERQRITRFCNSFAVAVKGGVSYPYATPGAVHKCLEWVKLMCEVDSRLINPPGINCTNGILEIHWDGETPRWELVAHDPNRYYIYEPLVKYDPQAPEESCSRLLEALDAPQRDIFLKTIAASLDLATIRKHKGRLVRGLLLKGDGNNGKDTLREAVSQIYGRIGMTTCTLADFASYDQGRKFPLARLAHARVNWSPENADTTKLDKIQSLKAFITGDTLSAEGKGKDEREFDPTGIALFNVNDTPKMQGTLEAIASRYGVLSFNKTFKIEANPLLGELKADPRFKYDPNFLRKEVLPAFLNRVLDALKRLMVEGIDYSCTQKALEDIQAQNSHLFQFCQDAGLGYKANSVLSAGLLWEQLEQWYRDNGTLSYEEMANGKQKAIWVEQANSSDRNVKGANQVLARFQQLFPKAKRIVHLHPNGKKSVPALQGIGFLSGDGGDDSCSIQVPPQPTPIPPPSPPQKTTANQGFHPTHPSFSNQEQKDENQNSDHSIDHSSDHNNESGLVSDTLPQLEWEGCDASKSSTLGVEIGVEIGVEDAQTGVEDSAPGVEVKSKVVSQSVTLVKSEVNEPDYSTFPHLTCDTIEAKRNQAQRIKQELKEADSKEELTAIRQQYSTRCDWVWHNLLTLIERKKLAVIAQTQQLSLFDKIPQPSEEVYSPQFPKEEQEWQETVEEAVSMMKIFNQDVDKEGSRIYQDQEQLIETLKEYYRLEVLEEAERRLAIASTKCEILVIGGTVLDPTIEWIPAWLKDCPERFQQYWAFELESGEMKHIFGRFQWRLV